MKHVMSCRPVGVETRTRHDPISVTQAVPSVHWAYHARPAQSPYMFLFLFFVLNLFFN
jgi:hypothetical protein